MASGATTARASWHWENSCCAGNGCSHVFPTELPYIAMLLTAQVDSIDKAEDKSAE